MTTATDAKLSYLKESVQAVDTRLTSGLKNVNDRIDSYTVEMYSQISTLATDFRADVSRMRAAHDRRCQEHREYQKKEAMEISEKLGRLLARTDDDLKTPDEVTAAIDVSAYREKLNGMERRLARAEKLKKNSAPPPTLLDAKRFITSPWTRLIGSILLLVVASALGLDVSGLLPWIGGN